MRSPVKDPGPIDTASASSPPSSTPASASARATRPGSDFACERDSGSAASASTTPSRTTPTAAVHVAVSRPSSVSGRCSPVGSALNEPMDGVVEEEDHQRDQQEQANLLRP